MVKNRFHSSIKKNSKFLEDIELENKLNFSPSSQQKEFSETKEISKMESREDFSNCFNLFTKENDEGCMTLSENYDDKIFASKKVFENLMEEKTIDMNFVQSFPHELIFNHEQELNNHFQFDDYFIL